LVDSLSMCVCVAEENNLFKSTIFYFVNSNPFFFLPVVSPKQSASLPAIKPTCALKKKL
jgi:hypothetical protein